MSEKQTCCPLCSGTSHIRVLSTGDRVFGMPGVFHIVRCGSCGMLFTQPRLSFEASAHFYPSDYGAHTLVDARHRQRDRKRDPWDRIEPFGKRRLLDVGCGSGAYLARQKEKGWNVYGVEPSAPAVEVARSLGLDVVEGTIPGVEPAVREFEVITMLSAFNHAPEPLATLREFRSLLVPGGVLILSVFNAESAGARFFGADWPAWDLPRIQSHFTPATLTKALHTSGFQEITIAPRRRTSLWRHACRLRGESRDSQLWRTLASCRQLCSLAAAVAGRGEKSDEMIAVARRP